MALSDLFIDPTTLPDGGYGFVQLLFLLIGYCFILFKSSKMIADGSEMLLLIASPGIVALVLSVLGAVPDGAIVLMSGLGPDAQEQLNVGIGTLAGSTIMLLTLPYAACIWLGRVDIEPTTGKPAYSKEQKLTLGLGWRHDYLHTGVQVAKDVPVNAKLLMLSALTYLLINSPAWAVPSGNSGAAKGCAIAGLVLSVLAFLAYCFYQVYSASAEAAQQARVQAARKLAVSKQVISVAGLLHLQHAQGGDIAEDPVSIEALRAIFRQHDLDESGELDKTEVKAMLHQLGFPNNSSTVSYILTEVGGADQRISFEEFVSFIQNAVQEARQRTAAGAGGAAVTAAGARPLKRAGSLNSGAGAGVAAATEAAEIEAGQALLSHQHSSAAHAQPLKRSSSLGSKKGGDAAEEEEEEEEDEDEEEEHHLTPFQIKMKAGFLLLMGVGLCTVFSDPVVDVISELGSARRLNVPPFYLSFILTPLVSNASEVIAAVIFASRRTSSSISLTYNQLLGAAIMNNTFCLAIFLALVVLQGLKWTFSSEVTAILAVELVVGVMALKRQAKGWQLFIPLLCYPFSLVLVYLLDNYAGWQ